MDRDNKPHARQKTTSNTSSGVHLRGSGTGSGRVGSSSGHSSSGHSSGGGVSRAAVGGGGGLIAIIIAAVVFFTKCDGLNMLGIGGGSNNTGGTSYSNSGGYNNDYNPNNYPSGSGSVNNSVASGSRAKRTSISGGGRDSVTIMVYMCGTDLESKHGMASADMEEMRAASTDFGNDFNLLVYTGGCKGWKNGVSSKVNQIYSIKGGKITTLVADDGAKSMVEPSTLSSFIKYCNSNYPANRRELILWDHGGGSVSGYGYDEKFSSKGSMNLAGINKALGDGGVTFDFIGFDACLMATAENALMLDSYGDYLIASEETEPGIGWYYTNWLKKFAKDPSMSTLDVGKIIIDDFTTECSRKCKGQKTTLSIIDLAEFAHTVPEDLSSFARGLSTKIASNDYKQISDARYNTREFAQSSKIDQVDLVHLAENMKTSEGRELASSLKSAVKYNRTSSNMTNAYGVSIYFPYKRTSYVDKACNTYQQIGMDSEYAQCIRQFASLETGGQVASGGSSNPIGSLFGIGGSSGSSGSTDLIGSLLGSFLGGGRNIVDGLDETNTSFMDELDSGSASQYLAQNYFDVSKLVWAKSGADYKMTLPDAQWDIIHALDRNMFYDNGEGWVDLGLDNTFDIDGDDLVADTAKDWVAIDGQIVAYYHTDSVKEADGTWVDTGYVPAMLNGNRVNLIIVFEEKNGNKNAYIAGATDDYINGETDTVAKSLTEVKAGDKIDFLCDFYDYNMNFRDSYFLGEQMTLSDNVKITNAPVGGNAVRLLYRFTDIYNQEYWSPAIEL